MERESEKRVESEEERNKEKTVAVTNKEEGGNK